METVSLDFPNWKITLTVDECPNSFLPDAKFRFRVSSLSQVACRECGQVLVKYRSSLEEMSQVSMKLTLFHLNYFNLLPDFLPHYLI